MMRDLFLKFMYETTMKFIILNYTNKYFKFHREFHLLQMKTNNLNR